MKKLFAWIGGFVTRKNPPKTEMPQEEWERLQEEWRAEADRFLKSAPPWPGNWTLGEHAQYVRIRHREEYFGFS